MNKNLTEIVFLLDRSGSMSGLEEDTIGGFNSFIERQNELGETRLTTVLFDNAYELLHNGLDAKDLIITEKEYFTRGSTALLDAIGKTILDVGLRLSNTDKKDHPSKVIFVITTDGQENSSREFTYDKINNMIEHQKEKYSWEFIFMGANIDVAKESFKLGIDSDRTFAYQASRAGTNKMYDTVNEMTSNIRSNKPNKKNR